MAYQIEKGVKIVLKNSLTNNINWVIMSNRKLPSHSIKKELDMKTSLAMASIALWLMIFVVAIPYAVTTTAANDRAVIEMHKLDLADNGMGRLPLNPHLDK